MLSRTVSYLIELCVRAVSEFGDERQAETGIFMHAHDRQIHTTGPILSVFPALIVHSELKSVHPGFTIRYDTRCYFNVRSKADISQLNLPHGTDN